MSEFATLAWVLAGLILMGLASAWTGLLLSLKGDVLSGDVIAHGVLPGIAIAFLGFGSKEIYYLVPGALLSGWLTLEARDWLVQRAGIRQDTASAMALSVSYGLGIVLLSMIRYSGQGAQSGLDRFLFGSAATILPEEIIFSSILMVLILVVLIVKQKALFLIYFDREWAKASGFRPHQADRLLTLMTLICVVTGVQMAGVVLMSSFLIAPAVVASAFVRHFAWRVPFVAGVSALAVISGALTSSFFSNMPTGPWVVVYLSLMAFGGLGWQWMIHNRK
jgi:manganese/zinc/iron transport system permease protein